LLSGDLSIVLLAEQVEVIEIEFPEEALIVVSHIDPGERTHQGGYDVTDLVGSHSHVLLHHHSILRVDVIIE